MVTVPIQLSSSSSLKTFSVTDFCTRSLGDRSWSMDNISSPETRQAQATQQKLDRDLCVCLNLVRRSTISQINNVYEISRRPSNLVSLSQLDCHAWQQCNFRIKDCTLHKTFFLTASTVAASSERTMTSSSTSDTNRNRKVCRGSANVSVTAASASAHLVVDTHKRE